MTIDGWIFGWFKPGLFTLSKPNSDMSCAILRADCKKNAEEQARNIYGMPKDADPKHIGEFVPPEA